MASGLQHYTERLAENPDWLRLRDQITAYRYSLERRLYSSAMDQAPASVKDSLRGEIRGLQHVLDKPLREVAQHQEHDE